VCDLETSRMGAPYIYDISRLRVKERRGYSHLKEEALDRTMWRAHFGRGFGPVVRQTTKRNKYTVEYLKVKNIKVIHKNSCVVYR